MAKNVCITRIENLLKESSFTGVKKDEIMNSLKQAMAERRVNRIDEINVDAIAKDVSAQIKAQKIIDRANALNDEIIRRKKTQFIIDNYQGVEEEGLMATIVGSNELRPGARDSVAVAQDTVQANLVNSFKQKVREAKLDKLFTEADLPTQSRLASVMEEAGAQQTDIEKRTGIKPPITETNPDIKKLGIIMEEHSEAVRVMLNDRGANIPKIWGWVVKHNHDQFNVRAATETLGMKLSDVKADVNLKGTDENYNKNFKSWKNFTSKYLDERTFDTVDDKEDFFVDVYNSLVGNKIQLAEGANNIFGSRNITKAAGGKRVLHFKSAKDWFTYHQKFGHGNLQETFLSGLMTAGRNIGMMDKLGSNPKANFDKIRIAVYNHVKKSGRDSSKLASNEYFKKFYMQIDGSNYTVENFSLAKYGSIIRMVQNITKLSPT